MTTWLVMSTQVDFGEKHARECGHGRFGEHFPTPRVGRWDADHPIHLIGHSYGLRWRPRAQATDHSPWSESLPPAPEAAPTMSARVDG